MSGDTQPGADLYRRWQDVVEEFRGYLDRLQRQRREIESLTAQSREELESVEREVESLQGRLEHMRNHPDSYGKEEILQTFETALRHEKRLAALRESYERLQASQKEREEHIRLLGHLMGVSDEIGRQLAPTEADGEAAGPPEEVDGSGAHGGSWLIYSLESQEHRQRALARQMHDGPAQALTNLMLQAEICQRLLEADREQASKELDGLRQMVLETFTTVRDYISELRPMSLDDLGLVPTLKRYLDIASERRGQPVTLNLVGEDRRLSPIVESALFRAAQELVSNALEFSGAQRIEVTLEITRESVILDVRDDGRGFDVEEVLEKAPARGTWGLIGLRERVALLEGQFQLESAPGEGTRIRIRVPADFQIEEKASE